MDKAAERETHDFMNVDSFSQLPFIRPAPPPKEKGIRLFGIEFGDNGPPLSSVEEPESAETTTNHHTPTNNNNTNTNTTTTPESGESSRRFECHYCCRNFPTSQALGGHQNAHKRERQHAKRQHLQSAMVHGTFPEGQVYGLMNYRFGSYASSPTMPYPTWNSTNSTGRFYGTTSYSSSSSPSSSTHHHHHLQQPINGSPLALWRIPNTTTAAGGGGVQSTNNNNHILNREQRSSLHPLPLFSGEELMSTRVGGPSRVELGASAASQNNAYVLCDQKTTVNDHVSLDLHL